MVIKNTIQISPTVARLTQVHAAHQQTGFTKRLSRCIVEESIMALDPELDFILESDQSLSEVDALSRVIGVNDVVISCQSVLKRVDVVILKKHAAGDKVSYLIALPVSLCNSLYIENGSLVVELDDTTSGAVVGFVPAQFWKDASGRQQKDDEFIKSYSPEPEFDLADCLKRIFSPASDTPRDAVAHTGVLKAQDYVYFLRGKEAIDAATQSQIINACIEKASGRENLQAMSEFEPGNLSRILKQSGTWEVRLQNLASRLHKQYPQLEEAQVTELLRLISNKHGGQPEAQSFKLDLSRAILKLRAKTMLPERLKEFSETLLHRLNTGRAVASHAVFRVDDYVKNKIAVDVANYIQQQRDSLNQFAQASGQELTAAFQHLSLEPAYATHSQSESSTVDDINEALEILAVVRISDEVERILSEF